MAYEKANVKSGRLFVTSQDKLASNPKLPALNGTIMIDGVVLYLGLWKRKAKSGAEYFTAELTYPADEQARIKATGKATSEIAAKEAAYDAAHPQTKQDQQRKWDARPVNRPQRPQNPTVQATDDVDDNGDPLPF